MKSNPILILALRIGVALILGQSLFYKFTGHPESIAIFSELGLGNTGRLLIGALELVAVVLLLLPSSVGWGAILSWGLMTGAILAHFTVLGWSGSRGLLGLLAVGAWTGSTLLIILLIKRLPLVGIQSRGDHH